ncbi:hypothetical protein L873DRAFT_1884106 [Choiromyces venosus 120613-1]|uniref:Uncharacterized protein n=1 Tax=Choiromyces venosus 120613-1 TaxID=1336337 RepID=A0A3N4K956_9PEZI|nr:hypothetical protein L873DRAFT_1884106 [Choiromyces venosus 120613-1]
MEIAKSRSVAEIQEMGQIIITEANKPENYEIYKHELLSDITSLAMKQKFHHPWTGTKWTTTLSLQYPKYTHPNRKSMWFGDILYFETHNSTSFNSAPDSIWGMFCGQVEVISGDKMITHLWIIPFQQLEEYILLIDYFKTLIDISVLLLFPSTAFKECYRPTGSYPLPKGFISVICTAKDRSHSASYELLTEAEISTIFLCPVV